MNGPLPTSYLDENWLAVINRWVVASVVLEMHHRTASTEISNNHPGSSNIILSDDSTGGMDIEEAEAERSVSDHEQMLVPYDANYILVNDDGEEDPGDSMDEAEEMVSFVAKDEHMGGDTDDRDNSVDGADEDDDDDDSSGDGYLTQIVLRVFEDSTYDTCPIPNDFAWRFCSALAPPRLRSTSMKRFAIRTPPGSTQLPSKWWVEMI